MVSKYGSMAMLNLIAVLIFLAVPEAVPSLWAAESFKMGVVDPQEVLERSKAGRRALAGLKEYTVARQKIIAGDEEELKRLEQEIKTVDGSLSDEEKREKQGKFREKLQAYQQRVQEFNQELASKQKELVEEYMKKISAVTESVAKKKGLALVVDKGNENSMKIVIYNRESIDVTDQVVREFDRRYK